MVFDFHPCYPVRGLRTSRKESLAENITLTASDPRAHNARKATSKQDSIGLFTQSSVKRTGREGEGQSSVTGALLNESSRLPDFRELFTLALLNESFRLSVFRGLFHSHTCF